MTISRRVRGFTLIELLVVMVLIALLASFAIITMPSTSTADFQREEARRLLARMELAHDEAILQARSLGLLTARDGYVFLRYEDDAWHEFPSGHPLRLHELPDGVYLDVRVDGLEIALGSGDDDDDEDGRDPQLYFLPGGEILPDYEVRVLGDGSRAEYRITPGEERWFELHEDRP